MLLPTNVDETYPDRSAGDKAHQQHHDYMHLVINDLPAAIGAFIEMFTSGALLAAGASATSAWLDFETLGVDSLRIVHTRTGGTYIFEVDWSRDGITVDVVEEVQGAGTNNSSVSKTAATRYGRVRVKNTHVSDAFTAHRTVVTGRA